MINLRLLLLLTNLHLKLLSTQGTGADKLLSTQRVNNDRAITQNTPKCVENCSDAQLSYICSSTYYQFFCNLDYNSENSVFLVRYRTNSRVRLCAYKRDQY